MKHRSQFATSHTASLRQRKKDPRWSDVADAYDAGLNHALSLNTRKRMLLENHLRAIKILNVTPTWAGDSK